MNFIFLCLFIGLSLSYNPHAAILYAKKYCRNYNQNYNNQGNYFPLKDSANFVSQSLVAGGLNFNDCSGRKDKGMLVYTSELRSCLEKKGWKKSRRIPKEFIGGYPIFNDNSYAMIATNVKGNAVFYSAHQPDRCDYKIQNTSLIYYYL